MPEQTRQRLRGVISLLRTHPEGLSTTEIAAHFDVTRQTAYNDIQRLTLEGFHIYEDKRRYYLDPAYQNELTLSQAQAWFLYLPLRRIVRAGLHRFQLVRTLLYQVATLLHDELAPHLVDDEIAVDEAKSEIFAALVTCWHRQKLAAIHYRRPNAARHTEMVIAPYWFEPAVWSDAFYLLCGMRNRDGGYTPLTLKLDRVQHVEPLADGFERPDSTALLASIEQTWGIWRGDEEAATTVQLRFHNRQFDRLRETRWHPTQRIELAPDGAVIWEADISEPQEMLPWIRGWGPDVEVLAPDDIRQQVASEAQATARLYGRTADEEPRFF